MRSHKCAHPLVPGDVVVFGFNKLHSNKTVVMKWKKYGPTVTLPRTGRPSKIDKS